MCISIVPSRIVRRIYHFPINYSIQWGKIKIDKYPYPLLNFPKRSGKKSSKRRIIIIIIRGEKLKLINMFPYPLLEERIKFSKKIEEAYYYYYSWGKIKIDKYVSLSAIGKN